MTDLPGEPDDQDQPPEPDGEAAQGGEDGVHGGAPRGTRRTVVGSARQPGQLGRDVCDVFSGVSHHEVIAADHAALDVGDRDAVMQAVTSSMPDAIVHCGAWTAVDACEGDPDRAFLVNALGTQQFAQKAPAFGA